MGVCESLGFKIKLGGGVGGGLGLLGIYGDRGSSLERKLRRLIGLLEVGPLTTISSRDPPQLLGA